MKTFAALIRRYVLATAAIVLLMGGLLVGQIFYVGFKSNAVDATGYRVGALADALKQTETGLQWGREHTPAEWMQGYAWAMVLDDNGNVIWQQDLPQKLNHRYTASEVAVFSHWYLADYPVQCWAADYGLFVVAEPVGTCWKYNIDMKQKMIIMLAKSIQLTMVGLLLVVLGCCLFFSWRGSKSLQTVTAGLDTLAQGGTVSLPAAAMPLWLLCVCLKSSCIASFCFVKASFPISFTAASLLLPPMPSNSPAVKAAPGSFFCSSACFCATLRYAARSVLLFLRKSCPMLCISFLIALLFLCFSSRFFTASFAPVSRTTSTGCPPERKEAADFSACPIFFNSFFASYFFSSSKDNQAIRRTSACYFIVFRKAL